MPKLLPRRKRSARLWIVLSKSKRQTLGLCDVLLMTMAQYPDWLYEISNSAQEVIFIEHCSFVPNYDDSVPRL